MKPGDLVRFCPEMWTTPPDSRPLGVVIKVKFTATDWATRVTVLFPTDDVPYSSKVEDFEVVNENW